MFSISSKQKIVLFCFFVLIGMMAKDEPYMKLKVILNFEKFMFILTFPVDPVERTSHNSISLHFHFFLI